MPAGRLVSSLLRGRRLMSSWTRLVLLLCGRGVLHFSDRFCFRCLRFPYGPSQFSRLHLALLRLILPPPWIPWILIPPLAFLVRVPSSVPLALQYFEFGWTWAGTASVCHEQNRLLLVEGRPALGVTNQAGQGYVNQSAQSLSRMSCLTAMWG